MVFVVTGVKINRSMEQNRKVQKKKYGQLIFEEASKAIKWKEYCPFKQRFWNNLVFIYKKVNLDSYLTSYIKVNSKLIIDLNVKPKFIKSLEENLCDFRFGKDFLGITPKA